MAETVGVDLGFFVGGVVVAIVSGTYTVRSAKRLWIRSRITGTEPTNVGDVSGPGDRVQLSGEIVDVDDSDQGEWEPGNAVPIRAWKRYEYVERDNYHGFRPTSRGIESNPFVIDDGTGEIWVAPGDREVDSGQFVPAVGGGLSADGVVAVFPDAFDGVSYEGEDDLIKFISAIDSSGPDPGDVRGEEARLRVGDEATVLGDVVEDADGVRVVVPPKTFGLDSPLVVADRELSETSIGTGTTWELVKFGIVGSITAACILGLLAAVLLSGAV